LQAVTRSGSDLPLLSRFVEASVLAEEAAAQLRKEGPVIAGSALGDRPRESSQGSGGTETGLLE
jgi:hypothetical protein